jgi:hypothetical protein
MKSVQWSSKFRDGEFLKKYLQKKMLLLSLKRDVSGRGIQQKYGQK